MDCRAFDTPYSFPTHTRLARDWRKEEEVSRLPGEIVCNLSVDTKESCIFVVYDTYYCFYKFLSVSFTS